MDQIRIGALLLSVLLPWSLTAQGAQKAGPAAADTAAKSATFAVADIHPSPDTFNGNYFHPSPFAGDRYVLHQATPLDLITTAYHVQPDVVTGGPPGLEFDHYDIVAKTPPGTPESDLPKMLQTLLADRFKLVVSVEDKPLPSFLLKVGKGTSAMKPAADTTGLSDCRYNPTTPVTPNNPPPPTVTINCTNMTMERFAEELGNYGWQSINHPVVDATGLKGAWDFDFPFTWQPKSAGALTIFQSMEKIGLMLEAGTAPRRAIAITSMADQPTANLAGVEKLLPAPPLPSFDVTIVKPSKTESKAPQLTNVTVNRMMMSGSVRRLIGFAWDISEKTIFNAPAYADDKVWDIDGKMPTPDTPMAPGKRPQLDFDQMHLMLQSLLMDRFGLKEHTEDRPGNGYTLLPSTPKMKKGDPTQRASCTWRVPTGEKDPREGNPLATQYMHCTNVTMDQFARELKEYSGAIIKTRVLNKSGIEGRYDLSVYFSNIRTLEKLGLAQGDSTPKPSAGPAEQTPNAGGAADPAGVPILLTDALSKQLGLKLVLEKRPIPALVVDHVNEMPTDN